VQSAGCGGIARSDARRLFGDSDVSAAATASSAEDADVNDTDGMRVRDMQAGERQGDGGCACMCVCMHACMHVCM
jgi:hypothetical protein